MLYDIEFFLFVHFPKLSQGSENNIIAESLFFILSKF